MANESFGDHQSLVEESFQSACNGLYELAVHLSGDDESRGLAARIFEGLSNFHHRPADCVRQLAMLLEQDGGDLEADPERRFRVLHYSAAHLKDDLSLYLVCECYMDGFGTERNEQNALCGFRRLWEGDGTMKFDAGLRLGQILMDGGGLVDEDAKEAGEIFDKIRKERSVQIRDDLKVEATLLMGSILREGRGQVARDLVRAIEVYSDALELSSNAAVLHQLARMYEEGHGLEEVDMDEAIRLYVLSAEQHYEPSILRLEELVWQA